MPPVTPDSDDREPLTPKTSSAASSTPRFDGPARPPEKDVPAAPEVLASLAEEEYEKELFGQIMSGAREQATPLRELQARADALAVPGKILKPDNASAPAAETGEKEGDWSGGLDRSGNPRWITLSLPEREPENGITPESVLPPSLKASPEKPDQQKDEQRQQQPAGLLQSLLDRFKLRPRPSSDNVRPHARRARPMRGFFRMLLLTVILAMVYHILSQRGWVPRLF